MDKNDNQILMAMKRYGGSFARNIAEAAFVADSNNFAKLKAAFPELWQQYAEFCKPPTEKSNHD